MAAITPRQQKHNMKTKTKILCDYVENGTLKTITFEHAQKHPVRFPQAVRLLSKRGIAPESINYVETQCEHGWTASPLDWRTRDGDEHACADCGRIFNDGNARDDHFMSPACPKHKALAW